MSKIALSGNASGTGTFSIQAPNSNTDRTLTLPDEAGTVLTSASDISSDNLTGSVTVDGSGNVGIGTSSVTAKLEIDSEQNDVSTGSFTNPHIKLDATSGTTNSTGFTGIAYSNSNLSNYGWTSGNQRVGSAGQNSAFIWRYHNNSATGTEAMRIDSSGNLLVGTTSTPDGSADGVQINPVGGQNLFARGSTSPRYQIAFLNPNGLVGRIETSGSATSYITSSDYRLKEDVQPMTGAITRLNQLNPVNFAWKVDGTRVDGFLAHEAQEIVPEAVSGEKDAVIAHGNITDAEGNIVQENVVEPETLEEGQTWTKVEDKPDYQGIDQAKLVPLLTAALQEAIGRIETLEAEVATLKGASA